MPNFGSRQKYLNTLTMLDKKEILTKFEIYFKENNQTSEDMQTNLRDLRSMNITKLTKIYNLFF